MICPNDGIEMRPVKIESHYGQPVILDQCPDCGGVWFDQSELYLAKQGQAGKIESLDVDRLQTSSVIQNLELICPRDGSKLNRFTDPYLPEEIVIYRCLICSGLWLNRGEFSKYQEFRQNKLQQSLASAKDKKLARDIEQMLAHGKTGDTVDVLGRLGKFLSTPLDSTTWRPLEPDRLSEKEKSSLNLILNALSLVLRLFIRF
jgi:Zn-finger nucleic acid-binding protein